MPIRVLVVEEDCAYAQSVRDRARDYTKEFEIITVTSFGEASEEIARSLPDAVIADLQLPDSQGLDTLTRLSASLGFDVPIIAVSPNDDRSLLAQAVDAGAQDYFVRDHDNVEAVLHAAGAAIHRARARGRFTESKAHSRETEAQIRQAQKMEAVGRLAGGVAHDFNNVLTAIFGYADLLIDSFDPHHPGRNDLLEIKRAGERAANLTRQLLAFSRKQVLQPRRISLNDVVTNIEQLLRKLMREDIQLRLELDPSAGNVHADPGQVEQVLMNLAANARDAMPDGGTLTISTSNEVISAEMARTHAGFEPGEFVRLRVTDTGAGIPENIRRHIFEPFFTTKEQGKGTGLGLATVYGIVKQSGGWIYVSSEPAAGTTFSIYLKRAEPTSSL